MATKKQMFLRRNPEGKNIFGVTGISYSGYGYGKHYAGMDNLYGYGPDGQWFDYICTHHRRIQIVKMMRTGQWWELDQAVRDNYSTNGYTTRVGVRRASLMRCKQMSASHAAIPHEGKAAHEARVRLRN